ncbi:hypothetical protein [Pedobacter sp. V48]|uniref:hypothetical protein n=1 Tax=Pedobacter sp. V48 TaxID=509635 RepID=UPI0003E52DAE|nr:hypothetical protein [Pedobacter sp. V48]ETZ23851.1 hypothetical protein N824_15045 [Pedobacter sp. V48]
MIDGKVNSFFQYDALIENQIQALRSDWQRFVTERKHYKGQQVGHGRGIVITAGGLKYFTSAYILVSILRTFECTLPIEIWFHGDELSKNMCNEFEKLGAKCLNTEQFIEVTPGGFLMKALAIMFSNFREVLYLDADNVCLRDPAYLFENEEYKKHGCIFWPDFWQTPEHNPIWKILDVDFKDCPEQESGQLIVDKLRSWDQLQLCIYFNMKGADYYRFLYGDKDTFRFAWMALKTPYYMVPFDVGSCGVVHDNSFFGNTMVQHDCEGKILFMHRNLLKWDITLEHELVWKIVKKFSSSIEPKFCELKGGIDVMQAIDLHGDTLQYEFNDAFPGFERTCLKILKKVRSAKFYSHELMLSYLSNNRR